MGFRTLQALIYGTLARKPVWVLWGDSPHTEGSIGGLRRAMRFMVSRWAERWFRYGQTSTEYLLSLGIPQDRIVQIQNSVDEIQYTADVAPKFNSEPHPVLLHIGQFVRLKGIDLRAAAVLQQEGHRFSVLLVGSGPDKQKLEQLAKDLKLHDVHFHSSLKPEEMPAVYRSGDCLIFPTLGDVWGTGPTKLCCRGFRFCVHDTQDARRNFSPKKAFSIQRTRMSSWRSCAKRLPVLFRNLLSLEYVPLPRS